MYDQCWGRLNSVIVKDIISACSFLRSYTSIRSFIPLLLLGVEFQSFHEFLHHSEDSEQPDAMNIIGELILWAERYGRVWHSIPAKLWPKFRGPRTLLSRWKVESSRCCKLSRPSEARSTDQLCAWDSNWEAVQSGQRSDPYREALQLMQLQSEQQIFQLQQYMHWLQYQPRYSEQMGFSQPNFNLYHDLDISVH